jgi:hypothetical protein
VAAARLCSRGAIRSSRLATTGLAIGRSVFIGRTAIERVEESEASLPCH